MTINPNSQRALIWLTLALATIYSIGLIPIMGFVPAPSPSLNAVQVSALYSAHNIEFRCGVVLCILGGGMLIPLSAVVAVQMARLEKGMPIWAIVQSLAGCSGSFLLWGPPIFWGAAAYSVVDGDPRLTLIMHQLGWLSFITVDSVFWIQLAAIAIISLGKTEDDQYSAFPRWFGYLTIWQALQGTAGLGAMIFRSGPLAWNGILAFYIPLALFGVWLIALSYIMLRAIRHQAEGAFVAPLGVPGYRA